MYLKKIVFILILNIIFCSAISAQIVNDTIDLGRKMLILKIPEFSKRNSVLSFYTEGFFIDYPLSAFKEKPNFSIVEPATLEVFDGSNMVDEIFDRECDKLLYDSINPSSEVCSKKSFVKNGKFYRQDSYKSGFKIRYLNVLPLHKNEADEILDSIILKLISNETGDFIHNKKKRKINFETGERIDWDNK